MIMVLFISPFVLRLLYKMELPVLDYFLYIAFHNVLLRCTRYIVLNISHHLPSLSSLALLIDPCLVGRQEYLLTWRESIWSNH